MKKNFRLNLLTKEQTSEKSAIDVLKNYRLKTSMDKKITGGKSLYFQLSYIKMW